jgi:uncharacterized protein
MKTRLLEKIIKNHIVKNDKSLILLGPRQTGKSTLLKSIKPHLIVDLSDEATYREHLKDPSLIKAQVKSLAPKATVMIDEVQRIPSILNTLQSLIDNEPVRFLLTGSSARKLRRGKANLLPGRLFWYSMFPLTYWELQNDWDLAKALTIGTLPEVYIEDYGSELLSNYINTYLREEIQAEALLRNIDSYARFLDIAAESSGQIVNYSKISSDSEIPKESIRRFYEILHDTLLVHKLSGYTDVKSRKATQKERFIFFDLGVKNAVLGQHKNVFTATQLGHLFEQWFINQVVAYNSYHKKDWRLSYFRDERGNEIDLIIDSGQSLLAIEIKFSTRFRNEFADGLKRFFPGVKTPFRRIVIFRGEQAQKRDGFEVIPYEKFLLETISEIR